MTAWGRIDSLAPTGRWHFLEVDVIDELERDLILVLSLAYRCVTQHAKDRVTIRLPELIDRYTQSAI